MFMVSHFKSKTQIYSKYNKLIFDNLSTKHNWKYLKLHKYNPKREILNLRIINFHKTIGLYKELSYLRAGSLRIDILQRIPMILCTFMQTFIHIFTYYFPMKNTQET